MSESLLKTDQSEKHQQVVVMQNETLLPTVCFLPDTMEVNYMSAVATDLIRSALRPFKQLSLRWEALPFC